MEEEVASKKPGLAVVRTRKELTGIIPYVSGREVGMGIVYLIIEFRGNRRAGGEVVMLRSLACRIWR